ncbi:SusC/RagA family TonB-linked outer membrane protein [Bacteroidia bacterium]|nr:SusC/RagA family TonB-linked outer membrane protein [Bacteroidia bacterium]
MQRLQKLIKTTNAGSKYKIWVFSGILFFMTAVAAHAQDAINKRIDVTLSNATLKDLFAVIERNSNFRFLYDAADIDTNVPVSANYRNTSIQQILKEKLTGVVYEVDENQIVVKSKARESKEKNVVSQQSGRKLTGKVVDKNGEALPGATILVVGSPRGVFADENGNFEMDNVAVGTKLSASLIGMQTKPFDFQGKGDLIIVLEDNINELNEVTIVAFGKQKKSSVVASIETVNTKDLRVPASNLTSAFAGKIPGLISYQTSGEPGADNAQFFVRGVTTFGYATSPLILIDGFESTSDDLARMTADDIESFSILKDASAAVLYGSRGANGIILVTTKSGNEGKVKINARMDVNVSAPTELPEMIDGIEYMRLYNRAYLSDFPDENAYYSEQKIQATIRGDNPMIYPNVNWYDMLFNKQTINTKANVNVSGGGKVATYFVSAGYENENGLLKVDNRNNFNNNINIDRFNLRNNVTMKLTPTTTLDTRLQARYEKYTGPNTSASDIFQMVMSGNPVDFPAVYKPDEANRYTDHTLFGSRPIGTDGQKPNPYAEMVRGYETRDESTVTAQATILQDLDFITKGLKIQAKASASTWSRYGMKRSYRPFYYDVQSYNSMTDEYRLLLLNPTGPNGGSNSLTQNDPLRNTSAKYYFEVRANWDRTFDKHSIGAMTVMMVQENLFAISGTNLFESLPERNVGNSGRLTYDYDDRYFVEFGYGYNGSEKFSGSKRFGFFPSIGAGWLISNESFWASAKDVVDLLKLKFTWGKVGNDAIASRDNRFHFMSQINPGGRGYRWGEQMNNTYNGYSIARYANPNIGWEVSEKYNLGLEVALFKNGPLKLQVDVFKDNRRNIYMERSNIPSTVGLQSIDGIYGNVGAMESKGIDASIDYQKFFTKDFWLTGRANLTYAVNKYTEYDEPDYADEYLNRKGRSAGVRWGYVAERLFVDDAEVAKSPSQLSLGSIPQGGDIKYRDINGDGVINMNDRIAMGFPTTPEMQYGFGLSGGYKKFDASFFFQGNARVSFFIDPRGDYDNNNKRMPRH